MSELQRGALVQHSTLGLGKVVALEGDAVHVFFPGRGERYAAKLRLPGAMAFLRVGVEGRDAWLEGLTSFTFDSDTGRWALPARWLTLDQALGQFLAANPKGFTPGAPGRGAAWRAAIRLFEETLGGGQAEALLEKGNVREAVKRVFKVAKAIAPLHAEEDRDAFEDALGDDEETQAYLQALFELLGVPSPGRPRFDKLLAAVAALPATPSARWILATAFPALGRPDRHPAFRPGATREAAERLGFDLRVEEGPTWSGLHAVRALSQRLLESLAPSGAKDLVDVEVFVFAASSMRAGGAKRAAKRPPKAPPPPEAKPAAPAPVAKAARTPKAAPPRPAPARKAPVRASKGPVKKAGGRKGSPVRRAARAAKKGARARK